MVKTHTHGGNQRLLITAMLLFVVLFLTVFMRHTVFADYTDYSPNPADMQANGDGGLSHVLKNENVAQVVRITEGAYYPTSFGPSASGRSVQMGYGREGEACNISRAYATGNVIVRIDIAGGVSKQYAISIDRICNYSGSPSLFFGRDYNFPAGNLLFDSDVNLYYAKISVYFDNNVNIGVSGDDTKRISFNFRENIQGTGAGQVQLAPFENASADGFGLRSAYAYQTGKTDYGLKAAIEYGYPCEFDPVSGNHTLRLYDADAGFGEQRMWATKNGVKLDKTDYNASKNIRIAGFDDAGKYWVAGPSNDTYNQIYIENPQPGAKYKFFVQNVADGTLDVSGNVISVNVPYKGINSIRDCTYDLNPVMQITGSTTYAYTPNISITGSITKNGTAPAAGAHKWEMYAVRYSTKPNVNLPNGAIATGSPCDVTPAANRIGGCTLLDPPGYNYPTTINKPLTYTAGGPDALGTNVCFFTRVQNPSEDVTDDAMWKYSDLSCAVSGANPKLQVQGYDVKVGGSISTKTSFINNRTYGSYGEYGVFSNGINSGMGSGSGLLGGNFSTSQFDWSPLTFANVAGYGSFMGIAAPSYNPGTGAAIGASYPNASSKVFVQGERKTLQFSGTLVINGDLIYDNDGNDGDGYNSIADVPNIRIVADNIIIADGVKRIDPWLIARSAGGTYGTIYTCQSAAASPRTAQLLSSTICNTPLQTNGPIMANVLNPNRTADSVTGEPAAETFNLRADNFLSTYSGLNSTQPVAQTQLITELPPRF